MLGSVTGSAFNLCIMHCIFVCIFGLPACRVSKNSDAERRALRCWVGEGRLQPAQLEQNTIHRYGLPKRRACRGVAESETSPDRLMVGRRVPWTRLVQQERNVVVKPRHRGPEHAVRVARRVLVRVRLGFDPCYVVGVERTCVKEMKSSHNLLGIE